MPEIIPPKINGYTKKTIEALKFIRSFDHDCKNGQDHGCQHCTDVTTIIDGLDNDMREISAALTAIRQFAEDIRKHPTDTNGVVDYSSGRIIQIVDFLAHGKDKDGKDNLG